MKGAACGVVGAVAVIGPIGAGLPVYFHPLAMEGGDGTWVKLATLDVLTPGGEPQLFKVVAARQDAWTRHAAADIGSVFLFRTGEEDFARMLFGEHHHPGRVAELASVAARVHHA